MKISFLAANILPAMMTLMLGSVLLLNGCQNNNNVTVEPNADRSEQQDAPNTSQQPDGDGNSGDNSKNDNSDGNNDQNDNRADQVSSDDSGKSALSDVPAPLKGVWFENTDEGRMQCTLYQVNQSDQDLLGAVVFEEQSFRSYAEYGEGNYSKVTSVENTGQNVWLIKSNTEIEGDTQASISEDTFVIDNELLFWTYEYTEENKPVEYTQQLFRCKLS